MRLMIVVAMLAVPLSLARGQTCHPPYSRWTQKTETDLEGKPAETITVETVRTTWDTLSWDKRPQFRCAIRAGRELKNYRLTAFVRRVRSEGATKTNPDGDGDWHIELTDAPDEAITGCMVAEIPPERNGTLFKQARADLLGALGHAALPAGGEYNPNPPVQVTLVGLAFFDGEHRRAAPDRTKGTQHGRCNLTLWEIHPIYRVMKPGP